MSEARPRLSPKVSVIVPFFCVQDYIEECLRSILDQSLKDIEVIVINDQSPDSSRDIVERLARGDSRVRLIDLDANVGQGFARNVGIELARGAYIFFVDSDDRLADNQVLEQCHASAEETGADLVRVQKLSFWDDDPAGVCELDPLEEAFKAPRLYEPALRDNDALKSWHFWQYLYSRDLLERCDIRFQTPRWEERYFITKALKHANRLQILPRPGVCYRRRANSTTGEDRTQQDFDMMLHSILLVGREFPEGQGSAILAMQFADIFVGNSAWAAFVRRALRQSGSTVLSELAEAFSAFEVSQSEMDGLGPSALHNLDRMDAVGLLLAALRAHDWELAATAILGKPVRLSDVPSRHSTTGASDLEVDVQRALNQYARNQQAKAPFFAKKSKPLPRGVMPPTDAGALRIVNYGLFGWRLWALSRIVRSRIVKRGTLSDVAAFDRDPSGYMHGLSNPSYRRLAERLYPTRSVMGPSGIFGVWVRPVAWFLGKTRGAAQEERFRKAPVLFVRTQKGPWCRAIGRLLFPVGEVADTGDERLRKEDGRE